MVQATAAKTAATCLTDVRLFVENHQDSWLGRGKAKKRGGPPDSIGRKIRASTLCSWGLSTSIPRQYKAVLLAWKPVRTTLDKLDSVVVFCEKSARSNISRWNAHWYLWHHHHHYDYFWKNTAVKQYIFDHEDFTHAGKPSGQGRSWGDGSFGAESHVV